MVKSQYFRGWITEYKMSCCYNNRCSNRFLHYSTDVTQAYFQSSGKRISTNYLNPFKELNLKDNQPMQLLKPSHGLAESDDP